MKKIPMLGQRYGIQTVTQDLGAPDRRGRRVVCVCDCGAVREVCAASLRSGNTRSCGCATAAFLAESSTTHGKDGTPEHQAWKHVISRCLNPRSKSYRDYGGRGIGVCDRWRSFANFLTDMGEKPSPEHSIDRIDNDGNYEPGNCRWATRVQQNQNKGSNLVIEHEGQRLCLTEWARRRGMSWATLRSRIVSRGWDVGRALNQPVRRLVRLR